MAHKRLEIRVTSVIPDKQIHQMDEDVAGNYTIEISDKITEDKFADAALDAFHLEIPIKVLDDFSIEVVDGDRVLAPSDDHESGSLANFAYVLSRG